MKTRTSINSRSGKFWYYAYHFLGMGCVIGVTWWLFKTNDFTYHQHDWKSFGTYQQYKLDACSKCHLIKYE